MSKVATRQIVIDADVARAAGNSPDVSGVSKACREFLQAVLDICHQVVWTQAIAAEWKKHASRFSRKWRVHMAARRKLHECDALPVAGLESRVLTCNDRGLRPEKVTKDMHLVYAALKTNSPIASHDSEIRRLLTNALSKAPELRQLVWIDPGNPAEKPVDWLAKGAPAAKERMLGHTG